MASSNWPSLSKCPGSVPLGHSLHSRSPSEHFWGTFSTEFPENSKTPDLSSLAHFPRTIKTKNAHNLKPHLPQLFMVKPSSSQSQNIWKTTEFPPDRSTTIFTNLVFCLHSAAWTNTQLWGNSSVCNARQLWLRQLTSISHRITAPALPGPSDPLPWLLSLSRCLVGFHPLWTLSKYIIIAG